MRCLKTVLSAIAGVFAILLMGLLCVSSVLVAGYVVDRVLGFGFPAAGVAMFVTLCIILGTITGILECRAGRP